MRTDVKGLTQLKAWDAAGGKSRPLDRTDLHSNPCPYTARPRARYFSEPQFPLREQ